MDASDMLDVIHYYFEQDFGLPSQEAASRVSIMRETLYENMYNTTYKYAIEKSNTASERMTYSDADVEESNIEAQLSGIDPFKPATRQYTPTTTVNSSSPTPFGNLVDAPLG
jgi:hypothetical protein